MNKTRLTESNFLRSIPGNAIGDFPITNFEEIRKQLASWYFLPGYEYGLSEMLMAWI